MPRNDTSRQHCEMPSRVWLFSIYTLQVLFLPLLCCCMFVAAQCRTHKNYSRNTESTVYCQHHSRLVPIPLFALAHSIANELMSLLAVSIINTSTTALLLLLFLSLSLSLPSSNAVRWLNDLLRLILSAFASPSIVFELLLLVSLFLMLMFMFMLILP